MTWSLKAKWTSTVLWSPLWLSVIACSNSSEHGHGHGEPQAAEAAHGHGHAAEHGHADEHGHAGGHDSPGTEAITLWGEQTQLYAEFPALLMGQTSPMAAHLTQLADHQAVDRGRVVVELSGGDAPLERFAVDHPAVAGIFKPLLRPTHAGKRTLTLRHESESGTEAHVLGVFSVYSTRAAAVAAAGHAAAGHAAAETGEISFLLEQQWKIPFRVQRIETRQVRPTVSAFASVVRPANAEVLITAPRAGRVVSVDPMFPRVGDAVTEGAALFGISTAPPEGTDPALVALAVTQAEIRLAAARRELDRVQPLVAEGVTPRRRLDEAQSEQAAAEAELRSARRRRGNLSQTQQIDGAADVLRVPAPIAGTVAELRVAPGTWVSAGMPLARLVASDDLWLQINVPEAHLGRLGTLSGAWLRFGAQQPIIELPGSALASVGTEVDPDTLTLPVRYHLESKLKNVFVGMSTVAHLVVDTPQPSLTVPITALVDDAGTDVVFVQRGGEGFERRVVRLGVRDGDHVAVSQGVAEGEWVVSQGAWSVKLAATATESIGHGHAH